jgi:hypothetical protein
LPQAPLHRATDMASFKCAAYVCNDYELKQARCLELRCTHALLLQQNSCKMVYFVKGCLDTLTRKCINLQAICVSQQALHANHMEACICILLADLQGVWAHSPDQGSCGKTDAPVVCFPQPGSQAACCGMIRCGYCPYKHQASPKLPPLCGLPPPATHSSRDPA